MKVILLTGATDGIGYEAAKELVAQGHQVLAHGRSASKLQALQEELIHVKTYQADLADLDQVQSMVYTIKREHPHIDVILNNAGVFKIQQQQQTTTKVFFKKNDDNNDDDDTSRMDVRFVVNTMAPYLLTRLLLTNVPKGGRVINIASAGQASVTLSHLQPSNTRSSRLEDFDAYAQSKLAMIMWNNHMASKDDNHVFVSVNPGSLIDTKMVRDGFGVAGKPLSIGRDILVRAAVSSEFDNASGMYFDNDIGDFGPCHIDGRDPRKCCALVDIMDATLASYL